MSRPRPHFEADFVLRAVAALAGAIFLGEFAIMFVFEHVTQVSRATESLIDATVLGALSALVVVFTVVNPLRRHISAQVDELDALVRKQEWLQRVFESVDESIVVTDPQGVIAHVNSSFTRRMGWTAAEAEGKPTSILNAGLHPPEQYREMWAQLKTTGVWQGRVVDQTKSGELIELLMAISPLRDADGTLRGYVAMHRDLGDLLTHEQQLQRALDTMGAARAAAEETSAAKSRFLSTMSHEIRTPLAGILGTLELLDRGTQAPEQKEYTGLALRSARALLTLLNEVLDFSKLEAQGVQLVQEPFELSRAVQDVRDLFLAMAQRQGLDFEVVVTKKPTWVLGDHVRLKQVIGNLVGNALKFTTTGSVSVRLKTADDGDMVRATIDVVDTGIGIPAEALERLFHPFKQVDEGINRKFGGTGLGLAISRRLVEAMGGSLTVTSTAGQGSTFSVALALPRTQAQTPSGSTALTDADRQQVLGLKVLVAEDNPIVQLVISRILQKLGCVVSLVANGEQAVARASDEPFDAVLMDVQMPVMDGLEGTRRLRQQAGPGQTVPIIALTANAFADDREACRAAGMNDFLSKPVQEAQLVRALTLARKTPR